MGFLPSVRAATAAELPALDGAGIAVLGLRQGEHGTIVHLHAGGITMEDDWEYYTAVRPLPTLWTRDCAGRWHATRDYALRPLGEGGEVTLELAIAPPLEACIPWISYKSDAHPVASAGMSACRVTVRSAAGGELMNLAKRGDLSRWRTSPGSMS